MEFRTHTAQECLIHTEEAFRSFSRFDYLSKTTVTYLGDPKRFHELKLSITLTPDHIYYLDAHALDFYQECMAVSANSLDNHEL